AWLLGHALLAPGDPGDCPWRRRGDGSTGVVDALAGGALAGGVVAESTARMVRGVSGGPELCCPVCRNCVDGDACPGPAFSARPANLWQRPRRPQPVLGGCARPAAIGPRGPDLPLTSDASG